MKIEKFKYDIQDDGVELRGLFVRVPNGYTVIAQGLDGKLREKGAGLRFFYPWDKKYLYYINRMPIDFKKENYKSKEGFEIIVDTAVTFHKSDAIRFHEQKTGIEQLELLVSEILRTYISKHTFEEVSNWTLDVNNIYTKNNNEDINNMTIEEIIYSDNWIDSNLNNDVIRKILNFRLIYGISIDNIIIQKAELTQELKKSKEEDELTKAKNARMVATAQAELEASKLKAQSDRLQGTTETEILKKRLDTINKQLNGKSSEELKLIKAYLLGDNANYTVIENNGASDDYSKMSFFANEMNSEKGNQKIKK